MGYTILILSRILFRVYQLKNFENRAIFHEVIDMSRVFCFFDSQCRPFVFIGIFWYRVDYSFCHFMLDFALFFIFLLLSFVAFSLSVSFWTDIMSIWQMYWKITFVLTYFFLSHEPGLLAPIIFIIANLPKNSGVDISACIIIVPWTTFNAHYSVYTNVNELISHIV